MNICRISTFLKILFYLFLPFLAVAQVNLDSHLIERKLFLEEQLTRRLSDKISTALTRNSFEVSVHVVLESYTPKNKSAKPSAKDKDAALEDPNIPKDMTLGLLDAEKILSEYRNQLKTLEESKKTIVETKEPEKSFFRIKNVVVFAGIREELGEAYFAEFKKWLTNTARSEFGSKVVVNLQSIKQPAELKETQTPEKPWTMGRFAKEFQNLIAMILFSLTALIALIMWKALVSGESKSQRSFLLEMQMQGNQNLLKAIQMDPEKERKQLGEAIRLDATIDTNSVRALNDKIVLLLKNTDIRIQDVIDSWVEQNESGQMKCALFLDALVSAQSSMKDNEPHMQFLRSLEFPKESRDGIFKTLKSMSTVQPAVRLKYLEEVYWELLAAQTVDPHMLNAPYSYLNQMGTRDVIDILHEQPDNLQSMYVLTMPKEQQLTVIREMTTDKKRSLIKQTLDLEEVSESEISTLSDALKLKFKSRSKSENKVKTLSILPEILVSLSSLEQVRLLQEFRIKYPAKLDSLKLEYPSIFFIGDWNDAFIKKFVETCETENLLGVIAILPHIKERILSFAPEMTKIIIEEEVARGLKYNDENLNTLLENCQTRLKQQIERSLKKVSDIYVLSAQKTPRLAS